MAQNLCHTSVHYDSLTCCTLTSKDTVPLGTDTDPECYSNKWAADRVTDVNGKMLFTMNVGWRVLDAENIGYSYGQDVLRLQKPDSCGQLRWQYDVEGVRRAVEYFLKEGCCVIVVTTRDDTESAMARFFPTKVGQSVQVVKGSGKTDDITVWNQAFERNCPVVSKDNYKQHGDDLRIKKELRAWWAEEGSRCQVRFYWDRGSFKVDYDHQLPVLRPRDADSEQRVVVCSDCSAAVVDAAAPTWYGGREKFYCEGCWAKWSRSRR